VILLFGLVNASFKQVLACIMDVIMTIEKKRHFLLYGNRLVIYLASLIGLFFDANAAYVVALTLWLWLPQCLLLEVRLFKSLKHYAFKHYAFKHR